MHHGYRHDMKVEKEGVFTFAWVTQPERPKGVKDKVKRPEEPPTRSRRIITMIVVIMMRKLGSCASVYAWTREDMSYPLSTAKPPHQPHGDDDDTNYKGRLKNTGILGSP